MTYIIWVPHYQCQDSFLCSPLKETEFQELDDLTLWYQMCEKTHKCFAPNGINIIFANIFRAASSIEMCKTDSERWWQILRDMSKYECEPNDKTIVEYKKAIMDEDYNQALIEESFEDGKAKGEAQKAIAIAKAMLSNGISSDVVSICTGLSLAQISAL